MLIDQVNRCKSAIDEKVRADVQDRRSAEIIISAYYTLVDELRHRLIMADRNVISRLENRRTA